MKPQKYIKHALTFALPRSVQVGGKEPRQPEVCETLSRLLKQYPAMCVEAGQRGCKLKFLSPGTRGVPKRTSMTHKGDSNSY